MGDLTSCNYCSLSVIKRRAKEGGKTVTLLEDRSSLLGGLNVYVHPKEVKIKELSEKEREKYGGRWFMSLSDHCVC